VDTEDLLKLLKENRVDFVIIGATAFPVHGYARTTLDIDIFIKAARENAERAWKALKKFGYDMTDITIEDLLTKKLLIRQYAV
jgi:DNA polymerase IIIc chi subunit